MLALLMKRASSGKPGRWPPFLHPNILGIHDYGSEGPVAHLVSAHGLHAGHLMLSILFFLFGFTFGVRPCFFAATFFRLAAYGWATPPA